MTFVLAIVCTSVSAAAAEHTGRVTFGGLPLPGATVTAVKGDEQIATTSELDGSYRLGDLADGVWTIRVEMLGFATMTREVTLPSPEEPAAFELALVPFEEIATGIAVGRPFQGRPGGAESPAPRPQVFQRAEVTATPTPPRPAAREPAAAPAPAGDPFGDPAMSAADGLLINGSVNNGGATPFAQTAAFGNNRRGPQSLYNWGLGTQVGHSAWDARPYSFTGQQTPRPDYTDVQIMGTFGGPIRIPGLLRNGPIVFLGYQRLTDHNATTQSALMPALAERAGDFSQSPVTIVDPATGQPFPGNAIPKARISPQAAALLGYYPAPNVDASGRYNFQRPVLVETEQDSLQTRLTQRIGRADQLSSVVSYQRTLTGTSSLFGFTDSSRVANLDAAVNWSHRFSPLFSLRVRYQHTRLSTDVTPHFAGLSNVSGDAGIGGNNQDPMNWGPPALVFGSGLAGLGTAQHAATSDQTSGGGADAAWSKGRHYVTFGAGARRRHLDVVAQQDARGTFTFTGSASGLDFADFLLGIPHSSSIAFGNADKYLRGSAYDVYVNDDWRLSPSLTLNLGVRWEYETPLTEARGRLVNLDIVPGFTAAGAVLADDPSGALTGRRYPSSLVNPDRRGIQPRLGMAWRPVPGSSLVIRAGYGVYRNTGVYQSIATLLAQQPPLSTTLSVENSAAAPLTLQNGFIAPSVTAANTFAVDPDFRVGFAQNWQVSAQRDLPASLTMIATYLGASGSRLMQQFLPNTYPAGAENPCPACPSGFAYLTSNGSSVRHAGQVQLRRRLRSGFTATVQYTLSRATDNAAAFSGANLTGAAIAQDWLDLDAERGPSAFDQRHLVTAQFQYTTGVGVAGGALLGGLKGSLFKGWTVASQLTAGSGPPLTPVYLTSVRGTGFTGTIRAGLTGAPVSEVPDGFYLNPAAYGAPAAGRWGVTGRNSVTGPMQFSLNSSVSRTFLLGDRLNLDWRIDAVNVLNRVTYASVNAIVGSPQFGLPNRANSMRKLQTSVRLRF
jgi:hypothetical protein